MFPRAFAAHMAFDPDIVGRIGKNGGSLFSPEKRPIRMGVSERSHKGGDGRQASRGRRNGISADRQVPQLVCGVPGVVWRIEGLNPQIDLGRLKPVASISKSSTMSESSFRTIATLAVRAPSIRQLVVGKHVGFRLLLTQMLETDYWGFR